MFAKTFTVISDVYKVYLVYHRIVMPTSIFDGPG